MNQENPKKGLNINRNKVNSEDTHQKPMTAEEASMVMAEFYNTMGSGVFNMVAIMADLNKILGELSVDLNDMAFYQKKIALKMGAVSEIEILEHEKEGDEPPPENTVSDSV